MDAYAVGSLPQDWYIKGAKYVFRVSASVEDTFNLIDLRSLDLDHRTHPLMPDTSCGKYHRRPQHRPSAISSFARDRPETVESLFLAYRLTGNSIYREWGWQIFQSIEKHCKIETGGYASVLNVDEVPVRREDKMETFMLVSGFCVMCGD